MILKRNLFVTFILTILMIACQEQDLEPTDIEEGSGSVVYQRTTIKPLDY